MRRSVALALLVVILAPPAPVRVAADGTATLVAEGEEWWSRSPDPREPVACVTCHHDPRETRAWAASFPKYRPLPASEGRVMTLVQANAEAVQRHYGLTDAERPAVAIAAYLISRGTGIPVSPGVVAGQPLFEGRLRALDDSVGRGQRLYVVRCGACHDPGAVIPEVLFFPRIADGQVESLEGFLERHSDHLPLERAGQAMADIIAFLMTRLAGRAVGGSPQ